MQDVGDWDCEASRLMAVNIQNIIDFKREAILKHHLPPSLTDSESSWQPSDEELAKRQQRALFDFHNQTDREFNLLTSLYVRHWRPAFIIPANLIDADSEHCHFSSSFGPPR